MLKFKHDRRFIYDIYQRRFFGCSWDNFYSCQLSSSGHWQKIEGKFKRVTATCVGHEPNLASSYTTDVVPVLKYEHRGKDYYYVPNTGYGGPTPLGAKRTLYINPSNPKECYPENYFEEIGGLAWFGVMLIILGFVFLVIDLFI